MNHKILKKDIKFYETSVLDTPPTEYIEENIYFDEETIKNKELIRVDMNLVQFPIFSKNTKRKVNQVITYFFNTNRDTYITVTPRAGDYIPGELEEKIFIVLMQIMKEQNMSKKFIVTATEIKNKLNMNTSRYGSIIKNSLLRLATTNYSFKNTLYSSEANGIISEAIVTTIFSMKIITLLSEENKVYRDRFKDRRVKEVYEITMSEHFYKNIIQKGYMVYSGKILLEIESSIARTLYMLIEKLRFNNLYLKLDTIYLIKRIPLKFERKNLPQTIKTLEKSFQELVSKRLIQRFQFIKETTWEKSEVEVFFYESANKEKQERFFKDRNYFTKLLTNLIISETTHEIIDESKPSILETAVTFEVIEEIINLMPKKAKELKTLPKIIKEAIEQYGYEKVKLLAVYMKKQKVEKIISYFLKALKENWSIEENTNRTDIENKSIDSKKVNLPYFDEIGYNEDLYNYFKELEKEKQDEIEKIVYKYYIKKCGMETKIQKLAFMKSKKIYICEYLEEHFDILKNKNNITTQLDSTSQPIVNIYEIEDIKRSIIEAIELADLIFTYSPEEKNLLLKNILQELIPLKISNNLTEKILNSIIKKYIKL